MEAPRQPMQTSPTQIELLGVGIHALRESECVERIVSDARLGRGGWVVTPNLDHLRRLVRQPEFRALCARADLRVADGMPLVWASRLQRTPLPERVAGSNLIWSVSRAAALHGLRVFLLGGDPGTAEQAANGLCRSIPGLRIVGTHCPRPGFEGDPIQRQEMLDALDAHPAEVVFVALGSPKQELLIDELRARAPGAWWLGVGISFSFVTGAVRRAPLWMQRVGLEWVHRLCQEPRRLARRYLVDGLPFAVQLLVTSAWNGLRGG